ncbi:putative DegV domain-containing protein [Gottschalkia acidurici 9a]|uniref:DegV domain-containing protein n=1 Tax=Gottschalkia acidurici (strain ATCC 7906 / DSM 604 / BCRC 14475 / CIP 104303 / KCTC 5404 / NCIMB 10678 / 9a) TaxID=1128398 RepID=K0AZQ9_GOTA9|nr:DegV family protein [Gottschalkia acidurici]AFS78205.1 putative DegV domain-containing protein [Gottschalkia acidurici 9a]
MSNIQIVVDSTSYISSDYIKENNIEVVHLSVELDGKTDKEGLPGTFNEYFNRLQSTKDFPKTSQPPMGEFVEAYKRAFERGDEILAITFSSKLSGTYNSACMAAEMIDSEKITVIDSETAVGNYRVLIDIAVNLAKKGASREEILEEINNARKNTNINLTVESLEYLKRGGRLSNAQAIIGALLNIKPIIGLIDGELIATDKLRGKKKAIDFMISKIPENVKVISVEYIQNLEEAEKIKETLQEKFKDAEVNLNELGPVIGSHLGPKAIGICSSW